MAHLEKAIKRIDEAANSLNKMQRELDQLAPVFEASKTDVQLRQEAVEACQKEYAAAKDRCKKQEQDIELMQGPIEILKREAQAEFEKVSIHGWIKAPRGKQRPWRGSCKGSKYLNFKARGEKARTLELQISS